MRDEHVDNISLHTGTNIQCHKYSNFLVHMIYVRLALACPNNIDVSVKFLNWDKVDVHDSLNPLLLSHRKDGRSERLACKATKVQMPVKF